MAYLVRRVAGWFDGYDDYVEGTLAKDFRAQQVTIMTYLEQMSKSEKHQPIVAIGTSDTNNAIYLVYTKDELLKLAYYSQDNGLVAFAVSQPYPINYGKRAVIFATLDLRNKKAKIYIDGEKIGDFDILANDKELYVASGSRFRIGRSSDGTWGEYPGSIWAGDIYRVFVWDKILDEDIIKTISKNPLMDLSVYEPIMGWDFNRADWINGVLYDVTGNGNDAQIFGVVRKDVLFRKGSGWLFYNVLNKAVFHDKNDYVIVDANLKTINKAYSIVIIAEVFAGDRFEADVSKLAKGVGYYDSQKDAWRVDAGEKGYVVDCLIGDDEFFGKDTKIYLSGVQVDSSNDVKMLRVEIIDDETGEVMFNEDVNAKIFPSNAMSGMVEIGEAYLPRNRYRLRMYSFGNVGFWLKKVIVGGSYPELIKGEEYGDIKLSLYGQYAHIEVRRADDTYTSFEFDTSRNDGDYAYVFQHSVGDRVEFDMLSAQESLASDVSQENIEIRDGKIRIGSMPIAIRSVMIFDRALDQEYSDIFDDIIILDGLLHWFVPDEDGMVDLVTGKRFPYSGKVKVDLARGRMTEDYRIYFLKIVDERGE